MMKIKNLRQAYLNAKRRQNEYVHNAMNKTVTMENLNRLGNLAKKTKEAKNKLQNIAAKKIQNVVRKPVRPYILVFNRSNLNRYPKRVKNKLANAQFFIDPNNPSKKMFLTANGSFMIKNLTNISGSKTLSEVYTFLKERLPAHMLPKFRRINTKKFSDQTILVSRKANVIKRSFFPVRKVIHILRKHRGLRYAANTMERLVNLAKVYSNYIRRNAPAGNIQIVKNVISRNIGLCHINTTLRNNPSVNRVTYLLYYKNQMQLACEKIVKMPEQEFITKFKAALGNRPCIENLIDALSQVAFGETQWKGSNKALNLTKNNNKNYLRNSIIATYMKSHHKSIRNSGNMSNYTKNRLWNSIKNRPLYVITQNGPVFMTVKEAHRNTRKISNNAFNLYSNYL